MGLYLTLFLIFTPVHATDRNAQSIVLPPPTKATYKLMCPSSIDCPLEGRPVLKTFFRSLTGEFHVYAMRQSPRLSGFWHIAFRPVGTGDGTLLMLTNGETLVPTMIPVSDWKENSPVLPWQGRVYDQVLAEENGMFAGHPDFGNTTRLLPAFRGNSREDYTVIIDSLWNGNFAKIVDVLKERKCWNSNIFLAPVFLGPRSAEVGRHFWAGVTLGVPPILFALYLDKLPHEVKGFPNQLFQATLEFAAKTTNSESIQEFEALRTRLQTALAKMPIPAVLRTNGKVLASAGLSYAPSTTILKNGRIYYDPLVSTRNVDDTAEYFADIICRPGKSGILLDIKPKVVR